MSMPTFFIIGAPKAGTTSLHFYLDLHPEIHMSPTKEPHFFVEPEDIPNYVANHVTSLDEYEALFASTAAVRGEASPSYTEYPRYKGVPERISALVPNAKFIYLVRDPIERTVSHYMHNVAVDGERRSLREALGDLSDVASPYICASLYAAQLDRFLQYFSLERLLVIDQTDLLEHRAATLREIFCFLAVDEAFTSPQFADLRGESRERRVYPPGYMYLARRFATPTLGRLPRGARQTLRRSVEKVLWPQLRSVTLDDDLRHDLQELYRMDVMRLRGLTGKAFAGWSI